MAEVCVCVWGGGGYWPEWGEKPRVRGVTAHAGRGGCVDRCTQRCYWFSSYLLHPDGRLPRASKSEETVKCRCMCLFSTNLGFVFESRDSWFRIL